MPRHRDQTLQAAMEENEVDVKRVVADLQWVFLADEREVTSEFQKEVAQVGKDRLS